MEVIARLIYTITTPTGILVTASIVGLIPLELLLWKIMRLRGAGGDVECELLDGTWRN